MKEYTIAEILHIAADKHLAVKESEYWARGGGKEKFSCCAVDEAVSRLYGYFDLEIYEREDIIKRIHKGLENMGCPTGSTDAFDDETVFNAENQQARYAWLKFAAIIAEEQGV
jgi:hypothetical protein